MLNKSLKVGERIVGAPAGDQKSADWPPDRSHIELNFTNERAPA